MSKGYNRALAISGKPVPPGQNKQVWARYQKVASDTRLAHIADVLPDSYVALYELTRLSDRMFDATVKAGVLNRRTSVRLIRKIRLTGTVPVWVKPD